MDSKREEYLKSLHQQILQSSSHLQSLLSDSEHYKQIKTETNIIKYVSPLKNFKKTPDFSSEILANTRENTDFFQSLFPYKILFYDKIFHAKIDGFKARNFHEKCDKKSFTFFLFKTRFSSRIFGAFIAIPWESPLIPKYRKAFLFSFSKKTQHKVFRNENYSVLMDKNMGPCLGGGCDLRINDENKGNCSNLGFTFEFEEFDTNEAKTHLARDLFFELEDYEVFSLEFVHF